MILDEIKKRVDARYRNAAGGNWDILYDCELLIMMLEALRTNMDCQIAEFRKRLDAGYGSAGGASVFHDCETLIRILDDLLTYQQHFDAAR